jgi:hypothetical protein
MKYGFLILGIVFSVSCGTYYMDKRPSSIGMIDTKVSSMFVYYYYGSFPNVQWNFPKTQWGGAAASYTDPALREKVYYFPPPKEEMYAVSFTWPMVITSVYNDSAKTWLSGDAISPSEKNRIMKRFEKEIIMPMVDSAHVHKISDSEIYIQK